MQQIDRIDVLTTQLAAADRRALSQAWYSALHVAEHEPRSRARCTPPAQRGSSPTARDWPARVAAINGDRRPPTAAAAVMRPVARRSEGTVPSADRRGPKTAVARRLECAIVQRGRRFPSSLSVSIGGGRVHLLIRSDGSRTRLVALCAPSLRERVERALGEVRFALAGRGLTAELA